MMLGLQPRRKLSFGFISNAKKTERNDQKKNSLFLNTRAAASSTITLVGASSFQI
jgi:hypothetical protein